MAPRYGKGGPTYPAPGKAAPVASATNLMSAYLAAFAEWEAIRGYSPRTIEHRRLALLRFSTWCGERGIDRPQDVTRPILERYQRHIYHRRKKNGQPLGVAAQVNLLIPIRAWFKWLARQNHVLWNPAADLELPRQPKRLPKGLLSIAEVEAALAHADLATASGLRMRALLETFYSTGIRRMEAANLTMHDIDTERGALMVRQGKGNKDRLIPIGARACAWIDRYRNEVRPLLVAGRDDYVLFLDDTGQKFEPGRLGEVVKRHLDAAGITQPGSCHLFRHAMATHMLEAGADIRYIQVMLGHADLNTTQIYTQVSLTKLKEIHEATHPARLDRRA
jgi:integrase/recombinase XerD